MRDGEIRAALLGHLRTLHSDEPETIYRNELGLCGGSTRVDVAVINGKLCGYEIKSACDSLARLPRQVALYSAVLDRASVVVERRHAANVESLLPQWWGILAVEQSGDVVAMMPTRNGSLNPSPDPLSIVRLLWRDEALDALVERGLDRGVRSASRWRIWEQLASLPLAEVQAEVRRRLRERQQWPGGE